MEKKSIKLFKIASEVRNKAGRHPAFKNYESVNVSSKVPKGKEEEAKALIKSTLHQKYNLEPKELFLDKTEKEWQMYIDGMVEAFSHEQFEIANDIEFEFKASIEKGKLYVCHSFVSGFKWFQAQMEHEQSGDEAIHTYDCLTFLKGEKLYKITSFISDKVENLSVMENPNR
jgi:hypothetical protein